MSWKFNPFTTNLDYFEDVAAVDDAKRLSDDKTCGEDISALKLVRAINDDEVVLAKPDTFSTSKVLGIAIQAGLTGEAITILLFGKVSDPFFNFPVNDPLFLSNNGEITNVPPVLPLQIYSTNIGHSLGSGAIFINISDPIEL